MKIRQFIFVISILFRLNSEAQPYCTLPLTLKSTSISYARIIPSHPPSNNYRFFYRVLVECGKTNAADLYDLFILNQTNNSQQEIGWQQDSISRNH